MKKSLVHLALNSFLGWLSVLKKSDFGYPILHFSSSVVTKIISADEKKIDNWFEKLTSHFNCNIWAACFDGAAKSVNLFPDSKLALFRIKRDFLGSYHVVSYKDYNVSVLFFEKKRISGAQLVPSSRPLHSWILFSVQF